MKNPTKHAGLILVTIMAFLCAIGLAELKTHGTRMNDWHYAKNKQPYPVIQLDQIMIIHGHKIKTMADRMFMLVPAQAIVSEFLKTFQEFPPRAKAASFSIDQAMEKLMPRDSGGAPPTETEKAAPKKSKAELAAHN